MDKFTRVCLVAIVGLLATIAFQLSFRSEVAHADVAKKYQYQTVRLEYKDKFDWISLNKSIDDGWDIVGFAEAMGPQGYEYLTVLERR